MNSVPLNFQFDKITLIHRDINGKIIEKTTITSDGQEITETFK